MVEPSSNRLEPTAAVAAGSERRSRVPTLEVAAVSSVGRVRHNNQDAFRVDAARGVVIVADGMGGHKGGDVASRIAADAVLQGLFATGDPAAEDPSAMLGRLGRVVEEANAALFRAVAATPELDGMGTTVVAAVFRNGHIYHAHVGDSRLYRWRGGLLEPLTRDHSLVQSLLDRGVFETREQARAAGVGNNILTRGLGVEQGVDVELGSRAVEPGDLYLLCSDGLSGMVDDAAIAEVLGEWADRLDHAAGELLRLALEGGGVDNITLVLARPITASPSTDRALPAPRAG
jgi:protein phosphatase